MKIETYNLGQLINRKVEIEDELHQITGYFFPRPEDLFNLVKFNLIKIKQFEKAFNLMTEKSHIEIVLKKYLNEVR